jgi:hypothetical protein
MPNSNEQPLPDARERRASIRYRLEQAATGRAFISNSFRSLASRVIDLSREGIGLLVHQALEVGTRVEIALEGPGSVPVELVAEVVNCREEPDGHWRCGCVLVWKLTDEELALICRHGSSANAIPKPA